MKPITSTKVQQNTNTDCDKQLNDDPLQRMEESALHSRIPTIDLPIFLWRSDSSSFSSNKVSKCKKLILNTQPTGQTKTLLKI